MADIKFPRKSGEVVVLTNELCELWQKSNKLRNPLTNRVLTPTSKIIKDLDKQCDIILGSKTKPKVVAKTPSPTKTKPKVVAKTRSQAKTKPKVVAKPRSPAKTKPKVVAKTPSPPKVVAKRSPTKVVAKTPSPPKTKPKVVAKPRSPTKVVAKNPSPPKVVAKTPSPHKTKPKTRKEYKPTIVNIGGYKFITESIYGDGSCFFHSVARTAKENYERSRAEGIELRNNIADALTFDEYLELSGGILAKISLTDKYDIHIDPTDDLLSIEEIIKKLPNYSELHEEVMQNYRKFLKNFKTTGIDANENMVDFTSQILGLNIVILNSISGRLTAAREISKRLPTIFLYQLGQYHYEPLIREDGQSVFLWSEASKILQGQSFLDV